MVARQATVIVDANIGPYTIKMTRAAAVAKATGTSIDSSMTKATGSTTKLGQATGALPAKFGALASVGGAAFAGVGLAAAYAVKTFAEFDVAMDAVAAATGASEKELDQLGKTAIKAASDTKFGATEAARGMEALAKAGVETADIVGGALKGALDLAAAGEIEVAEAAETASSAMTQFGISGARVPHIADVIAAGAGKAQGSVSDMSMALQQSGLVASQMGLSLEETVGTLAAFAEAGLTGSDAGTSFRTMLLRLANPTAEAAALMDSLGIAAYDAQGNFVGTAALAGQLQAALGKVSQKTRDAALATLFGSDAIRGANVLYKDGLEGIEDWEEGVTDAGFAAEDAARRTDNLAGDLERLKGEAEAFAIESGGWGEGLLRGFLQDAEGAFAALNEEAVIWREDVIPTVKEFLMLDGPFPDSATRKFELGTVALDRFDAITMDVVADQQAAADQTAQWAAKVDAYTAAAEEGTTQTGLFADQTRDLYLEQLKANDAFFVGRDHVREWNQAVDDADEAMGEEGWTRTLDVASQAGRDNQETLDGMSAAAIGVLEDMVAAGQNTDQASRQMRATLYETGIRLGLTEGQAADYADQILAIPETATTTATFKKATAAGEVQNYLDLLAKLPKNKSTAISLRVLESWGGGGPGGGPQSGMVSKGFKTFPLPGGPGAYRVTQGPHPVNAIDYGASVGTPVMAPMTGTAYLRDLGNRSYGKHAYITGSGTWMRIAHMSGFARSSGSVSRGALLGWTGNTGNSTGPHAHIENYHTGGWTTGGLINTLPGEFVVNATVAGRNAGGLEALNAGRGGSSVTLINHGVIGSRIELENWLAKGVDNLKRQGRLS